MTTTDPLLATGPVGHGSAPIRAAFYGRTNQRGQDPVGIAQQYRSCLTAVAERGVITQHGVGVHYACTGPLPEPRVVTQRTQLIWSVLWGIRDGCSVLAEQQSEPR